MTAVSALDSVPPLGGGGGLVSASGFWLPVRRHLRFVLASVIVAVAIAAAYLLVRPDSYESKVSVQIGRGAIEVDNDGQTKPDPLNPQTEAQIARSLAVARLAATIVPGGASPADLREHLSVGTPAGAGTLDLTFTEDSAKRARDGAQALADAYVRYRMNQLQRSVRMLSSAIASWRIALINAVISGGTIISPAQLPSSSANLPARVVLAAGALIGLLAGWVVAVLRWRVDDRVRGIEELSATGLPVLGQLDGSAEPDAALANRLLFALDAAGATSVLICESDEGDKRLSSLLAWAVQESGQRPVTVAADLVLYGSAVVSRRQVVSAIAPAKTNDGLVVIVSGPLTETPSALIAASTVEAVVASAVKGETRVSDLGAAVDEVARNGGHIVGVVLVERASNGS